MTVIARKIWELIQSLPEEDRSFIREQLNISSEDTEETSSLERIAKLEGINHLAIKPLRKSISLEEMIEEQQYTPIKREGFYEKVADLDIQEPLDELLAMLEE